MTSYDNRDGLQDRQCGNPRCRWRGRGSAGEECPACGLPPEDYGPVFPGWIFVWQRYQLVVREERRLWLWRVVPRSAKR